MGILNTTLQENSPVFGVPFPGTLVLDARGVVRSKSFEQPYQDRDTVANTLLAAGEGPGRAAVSQRTPHLGVGTGLTDAAVAPGTVFSIVIDVDPRPGIHVYAPGAKGYRPVALAIEPQPYLRVRSLRFPESEDYHFKPLDEHVPVYQRPFRLVQELSIDAAREAQEALKGMNAMTIRGRLDYQACDDTTCFAPASLPLSWTLTLKQLDRERSAAGK